MMKKRSNADRKINKAGDQVWQHIKSETQNEVPNERPWKTINSRFFASLLLLSKLLAPYSRACAADTVQAYANKPFRLVRPQAPGGALDGTAQFLAQKMLQSWWRQPHDHHHK